MLADVEPLFICACIPSVKNGFPRKTFRIPFISCFHSNSFYINKPSTILRYRHPVPFFFAYFNKKTEMYFSIPFSIPFISKKNGTMLFIQPNQSSCQSSLSVNHTVFLFKLLFFRPV